MTARLSSFVVWAMVAASAVFWGLRLLAQPVAVPAQAAAVGLGQVSVGPLSRLFGAAPVAEVAAAAPVVADARFKLLGVVAPRAGERAGWALIAVDDRPARAFALGGRVDDQLVVQTISHRQVELGPKGAPPAMTLTLSALAEAARGTPSSSAGLPPPAPPPAPSGRFSGAAGRFPPMPQPAPGSADGTVQVPFAGGVTGVAPSEGGQAAPVPADLGSMGARVRQ